MKDHRISRGAIILAGGKSARMGSDKAFLIVNGRPLIERLVAELGVAADQVIISADRPERFAGFGVRVVADLVPNFGSLAGLHAGLWASDAERAFVCACDMPFIKSGIAARMLDLDPSADVVVPKVGEFYEPLCAVYSRRCLPQIEARIKKSDRRIVSFYRWVRVVTVGPEHFPDDPAMRFMENVNTPDDLRRLGLA